MIVTLNDERSTLKTVRLTPFIAIDPFSMIKAAKFASNSKSNNQLPVLNSICLQFAIVSTWP